MIYLRLYWEFFKTGLFSVGGGMATVPFILYSRVETVGKAAAANAMSIEAQVEELWGSSKDKAWIQQEVLRIKHEKGIEVTDEPKVGDEIDF